MIQAHRKPLSTHFVATVVLIAAILFVSVAHAAKPIYSGGRERAAIRGYDPVAYFTQNKPVKGLPEFSLEHQGATWLFSSAKTRDMFQADPDKYRPQFGGYCAYAVSQNTTASIKPQYFKIHNGKLYLNYSKSVNKRWLKSLDRYIEEAEENWPKVLND